jgi:hypothetical protein
MKNFSAEVTPYEKISGAYQAIKVKPKSSLSNNSWSGDFKGDWAYEAPPKKCIWIEDGVCGVRTEFINTNSISLKLRLPKNQGGWLSGRIKSPQISITEEDQAENLLTVTGSPAEVAYTEAWPQVLTSDIAKFKNINQGGEFSSYLYETGIQFLTAYKGFLKDTVTKIIPTWSVTNGFGSSTNPCLTNTTHFVGIVSTNATVYQGNPPTFIDNSLNYSVGSLHFKPDGTLNQGTYDLNISSEAARCLYNFKNAPIQATVQVITAQGSTETVATSLLSENDGWLHLGVYGFTFSNPTIQIKLSQEVPSSSTSTLTPLSKPLVKQAVTCIKGKLSKKIYSAKGTCPNGFKKKK